MRRASRIHPCWKFRALCQPRKLGSFPAIEKKCCGWAGWPQAWPVSMLVCFQNSSETPCRESYSLLAGVDITDDWHSHSNLEPFREGQEYIKPSATWSLDSRPRLGLRCVQISLAGEVPLSSGKHLLHSLPRSNFCLKYVVLTTLFCFMRLTLAHEWL